MGEFSNTCQPPSVSKSHPPPIPDNNNNNNNNNNNISLPLLCGSPCEDPCETLASCGQAFIAILSFAVGMLFLGVFFLLLDFFGLAPCGVNKLTGVLLWLGMLANFISCMVFLGSIGVTVAGHDDGKNTEYYFLPGLPPTGFQPSAGAICHYISLLTGVIGASLFRSAANGEAGSRGKGVQMSASIMSPSFRFANPTKSQTAKRPSSVKRHGSAKKPTVRGGHSYV